MPFVPSECELGTTWEVARSNPATTRGLVASRRRGSSTPRHRHFLAIGLECYAAGLKSPARPAYDTGKLGRPISGRLVGDRRSAEFPAPSRLLSTSFRAIGVQFSFHAASRRGGSQPRIVSVLPPRKEADTIRPQWSPQK
jgi:hypothetical protein